jgi:teichuronic acid biosynthesis glycosyltransferase TuaG
MPAYNASSFISQSIQSVIDQTYKHWELIIIDDCSTDNLLGNIYQFCNDVRIKVYKNKTNSGVSYSRNRGIKLAKNKLVAFLDADDIWLKDKLDKQITFINRGYNFVHTSVLYINDKGENYKGKYIVPKLLDYKKLLLHNSISCSSVLTRKEYLLKHEMSNDKISEDYSVWLRILRDGVVAIGIQEPLIIYRLYKSSKSGNKIKSFKMSFGVYRQIGHNIIVSLFFTTTHLIGSIFKYKKIGRIIS